MGDITQNYLLLYGEKRQPCGVVVVGYQTMLSGVGALHIYFTIFHIIQYSKKGCYNKSLQTNQGSR